MLTLSGRMRTRGPSPLSDEQLHVLFVLNGDVEAYHVLVGRYWRSVFYWAWGAVNWATAIVNVTDVAEDAREAVFSRYEAAGGYGKSNFDPERGPFWAWMRIRSQSIARDLLRKEQKRSDRFVLVGQMELDAGGSQDQEADAQSVIRRRIAAVTSNDPSVSGCFEDALVDLDHLDHCLERLDERARELLRLRLWEGFSYAEIQMRFAMKSGTVGSNLSRAREQLAACLDSNRLRNRQKADQAKTQIGTSTTTQSGTDRNGENDENE